MFQVHAWPLQPLTPSSIFITTNVFVNILVHYFVEFEAYFGSSIFISLKMGNGANHYLWQESDYKLKTLIMTGALYIIIYLSQSLFSLLYFILKHF